MALIIAWSGDAAWVFYLLTFIQLAAGIYGVVTYTAKFQESTKIPFRNNIVSACKISQLLLI